MIYSIHKWLVSSFLILNFAFLTFNPLHAQRVAVVLSGGAAKGGAHIGVLRALEEQQVPINYIIGTSIGAVVGGLYAAGYSPDEIENLMKSESFQRWASGAMDNKYVYYSRKEDPNASWITTSFDFTKNITYILPAQLIKTFDVDFQIMQLISQANAVAGGDFNKLMIPFRCVVADIDTTSQMVLRNGDMSTAVRGSMSLPLVFSPVMIASKLVYDGGMYNNFPCDVAMADFHPDVIIGSRVARRYAKPDRDDMVSQLLTMLMERQSDTIVFPNSVMIVPNIPAINLLDFSQTTLLADSGYAAAIRKISDIRKLVRDSVSVNVIRQRRIEFNDRKPKLQFDSIHITGLNKAQSGYVRQILKHGKKTITLDELRQAYFRFIDEGFIKSIYPVARFNQTTGFFDLYLDVKKSNKFGAQFGGNFSLGSQSEAFLELQYKYLWTKALRFYTNGYFGKVYSSAKIDGRIDFNSKTPWFFEADYTYNHFNYFKTASFFFDDKTPNYVIESEYFGELKAGIPFTNNGKLSLGLVYGYTNDKYYQDNTFTRTDTADQTTFTFFSPTLNFDLNNLNRKQFANAGVQLKLSVSYINGREGMAPGTTAISKSPVTNYHSWFKVHLVYDNFFKSLGPFKFGLYAEGVLTNQPLFSNYTSSLLYASAFQPIPESQVYFLPPFMATNFAAGGLKLVLKIYKKLEYRLEGYVFQPYKEILENPENLKAYFGEKFADRSYMASTAVVYTTPLGPISISVNYFDKMPDPFTINFNFGYIIFNARAMP
ncbi:MAG: patatin-like phospholipase family protein [Bacteroidetes bacterium]|nr:patatin-like phospholipase family protein [Bacteroidota bacterium]